MQKMCRYRPLSHCGHFESQENKKLCFCTSILALDERLDVQNLLFQHCMIKVYCRKSVDIAENLQLLQKICRKFVHIAENVQVLQKICRYCRKSVGIAENLQVLQKICCDGRKSAFIAEDLQICQKICR